MKKNKMKRHEDNKAQMTWGKAVVKIVTDTTRDSNLTNMFSDWLVEAVKSKKHQFCTVIMKDKSRIQSAMKFSLAHNISPFCFIDGGIFKINKWNFDIVFESDILKIIGNRRDRLLIVNGDGINMKQADCLISRTKKEAIVCCSRPSRWTSRDCCSPKYYEVISF